VPKIIAFPRNGIAYNECLYAAVEDLGIEVANGIWAGRWLLANVRAGDVIHFHWPSFLYYDEHSTLNTLWGLTRFFLLYSIIRMRGGRVIWTAHNLYPHDGGRHEWSHRLVRRFITRNVDVIVAHSPSARTILEAEFGISDENIVEVPHGNWIGYHPFTTTKAEARKALGIPPTAYVYCIVGACRPYKNLEALIAAFKRVNGDCFLLIAGQFQSAEYKATIDRLLTHLPSTHVRMEARFIDNEEVQYYVVAGDALVLPYTEILTSGSAMLGLSFGIPVIAPNIGGMADTIIEESGLLYDANDPDALVKAMRQIRNRDYSAATIIEHARRFDWAKSAQAFVAAVRTLN
jgi:glycosyltransferase involved in cell wall biosynthesis